MIDFDNKKIFETNLSMGNQFRRDYADSINRFVEKSLEKSYEARNEYMESIVENQEKYRNEYLKMIGQPVFPYPDFVPNAKKQYLGDDDFSSIYALQIEAMPDFWFFGILMLPKNAQSAPLVIAQHGGGSTPEICSEFLGKSNYNFFTKRALQRGMVVFAPQLLLWRFDGENGEEKIDIDVPFKREETDRRLKSVGLSITGLEVFCIRRAIDYLSSLDCVDENRIGMMGLSYGGYYSLHTAAADTRIKSVYAAGFFNDRTKIAFGDWRYKNSANTFCDGEVAALCAPRRLQIDVGKEDPVFDYAPSVAEAQRAARYYEKFNAKDNFCYTLWDGGHRFCETEEGFSFFFDGI